jgi:hypothetical protein
MKRNVGTVDRALRALGALALMIGSVAAPLPMPLAARVALFGVMAAYLGFTALAGTCLGYALLGKSTCPARALR